MNLTETQRGWLYVSFIVIGVIAAVIGWASEEEVAAIVNTILLLLSGGLATKNTLLKKADTPPDRPLEGRNDGGYTVWGLASLICLVIVVVFILLLILDVISIKG